MYKFDGWPDAFWSEHCRKIFREIEVSLEKYGVRYPTLTENTKTLHSLIGKNDVIRDQKWVTFLQFLVQLESSRTGLGPAVGPKNMYKFDYE